MVRIEGVSKNVELMDRVDELIGGFYMKKSLLGHLCSHIRDSAEDVATMSLQYLVTYYESLNRV